jgi:hypothetical protein
VSLPKGPQDLEFRGVAEFYAAIAASPIPTGGSLATAVAAAHQQVPNHAGSNTGAMLANLTL